MFQIVIVDDKRSIREGLARHVSWEALGYQLAGTAASAQEAIKIIESSCVDVLLTDIVMGDMSGLELTYFAKLINPDIKVIILSAYDRFDYAQKAIQLGAHSYLTKPVDLELLKKELLGIKNILLEEAEARRKSKLFMDIAKEHFFSQLRSHPWENDQAVRQHAKQLELELPTGRYTVLSLSVSEAYPPIEATLTQLEKALGRTICLEKQENAATLLWFPCGQKREACLRELLKAGKPPRSSLGISDEYIDLSQIACAYQEAQIALDYCGIQKDKAFCVYQEIKELFCRSAGISPSQEEELIRYLSEVKPEHYKRCVQNILNQAETAGGTAAGLHIVLITNHYMEQRLENQALLSEETRQVAETIKAARTLQEISACLMKYSDSCFEHLQTENPRVLNQIVDRAMQYIRDHYSEDITLNKLSQEVYVNPMYLSRLFKEKSGISYIDYLTEIRISHAKELLGDLSLRIYDIAGMVGYESRKHFGKLFKDHTGLSPKEYRNSVSG